MPIVFFRFDEVIKMTYILAHVLNIIICVTVFYRDNWLAVQFIIRICEET